MSIRLLCDVIESTIQDKGELLVMIALANYANADGEAYPSVETIGRIARMTPRSVRRLLASLEAQGYVSRIMNGARNGTNVYRLHVPPRVPSSTAATRGAPDSASGRADSVSATPDSVSATPDSVSATPDTESAEPVLNLEEPRKNLSSIDSEFNEFWNRYPRKVGKGQARLAYRKARKGATPEQIIDGLDRYILNIKARGTQTEYIRHASTWLNGECWSDAETATRVMTPAEAERQREEQRRAEAIAERDAIRARNRSGSRLPPPTINGRAPVTIQDLVRAHEAEMRAMIRSDAKRTGE